MKTPLGKYLDNLNSNKSQIARDIGSTDDRLNALTNEETAILYMEEFLKILYVANYYAGIPTDRFDHTISEIFPDRKKGILNDKFKHLTPSARLFLTHTQQKSGVEVTLGMSKNKISKFANNSSKSATAKEAINFCDAMNLDIFETFKALLEELKLESNK